MRDFGSFWKQAAWKAVRSSAGTADVLSAFVSAIIVGVAKLTGAENLATLDWWWLVLIAFGIVLSIRLVVLAPYWTYRDLKDAATAEISQLTTAVTNQESEHLRQRRIELTDADLLRLPYLATDIASELELAIPEFVNTPEIKRGLRRALKDVEGIHGRGIVSHDQFVVEVRRVLDLHAVGFNALLQSVESGTQSKVGKAHALYRANPCSLLTELMNDYFGKLAEFVTLFIIWKHIELNKPVVHERLQFLDRIETVRYELVEVTTGVSKRVGELLMGEEPK